MGRYLIILAIFLCTSLADAGTRTKRRQLYKPAPGETGYGNLVNDNFSKLDNLIETPGDALPDSPSAQDDEFDDGSIDGKWSWVNQGDATLTEPANLGHELLAIPGTSVLTWRLRVQTAPSAPYTIKARTVVAIGGMASGATASGIVLRRSANGKFLSCGAGYGPSVLTAAWDSPTVMASSSGAINDTTPYQYAQFQVTSANASCYMSVDGIAYVKVGTTWTLTTALGGTPDQVGFGAAADDSMDTNQAVYWFRKN